MTKLQTNQKPKITAFHANARFGGQLRGDEILSKLYKYGQTKLLNFFVNLAQMLLINIAHVKM